MTIERDFEIPFVAGLALREKQIQQNYRPIIAVHKWFARRPGTLFRALLLAEFGSGSICDSFFRANRFEGIRVGDPFMGGGTPLLEANRLGCDVVGYDINPMAYWIVRQELEYLDLDAYQAAAARFVSDLNSQIGHLYQTECRYCHSQRALVKYFLWVKTLDCVGCNRSIDLFPGFLVAEDRRHPRKVLVCLACGELNEAKDGNKPGPCLSCQVPLLMDGPARGNRCACRHCGTVNRYPAAEKGPPRHRMFAMEYYCQLCKGRHKGRFFKRPDRRDLAKYAEAGAVWSASKRTHVPDDGIPPGDETDRLHRWGYRAYHELFNERQLLGLELSARGIAKQSNERVRNALATNLSDLLRYQNMLCRYDTTALKSLDIFSVHGFPVGLIQCESNLLGIPGGSATGNVGSGGWSNIIEKYLRAKTYCERPFEVRHEGKKRVRVFLPGEWIGDRKGQGLSAESRRVTLCCQSATLAELPPASLDGVFTDPPYFGNVQYAELMDFCYVWLRRLVGAADAVFQGASTRSPNELTGNATLDRGLNHFAEGISAVFCRMATALKPRAPLAFTFHHNTMDAYFPIAVAILDAGLACTASLPCPAEMAGSIHINGTGSSIVDTVFVCRSTGTVARHSIVNGPAAVAGLVLRDLDQLRQGGGKPTLGDTRCIFFGHLIRLAIWSLRTTWDGAACVENRLAAVAAWLGAWGDLAALVEGLQEDLNFPLGCPCRTNEEAGAGGFADAPISF